MTMKTLIKSNSSLGLCSRNGKGLPILPFLGITALVVWGAYLFSTVGFSLTPLAISLTYISPYIKGIIIGLILGDGSLQLLKGRKNASPGLGAVHDQAFRLGQCSANSGFLWHVFSLLQHYCQSYPSPYFGIRKGRPYFHKFMVYKLEKPS
jgi:LAGLIDADG DNA endonuclease family